MQTLSRGFVLLLDQADKPITSSGALSVGQTVRMRFSQGSAEAVVTRKDTE